MSFWEHENIRAAVGGMWVARAGGHRAEVGGVGTDSRTLSRGQVYFALRGERFDGHRFIAEAAARGSPLAVIDDSQAAGPAPTGMSLLKVPDARAALLRLAGAYRRTLEGTRVVAITGSNGKTTTARLVHAVLGSRFRGSAPTRSFNNDVGVPLTILGAKRGDQYLVCEVGTNHRGEIASLGAAVQPDIAVITSIGRAHLAGLGTLADVAREKWSLTSTLRPGGLAIVPADSPALAELIPTAAGAFSVVTFGASKSADVRVTSVGHEGQALRFTLNGRWEYTVPLVGDHNALNAAAAVAVARRFAMEPPEIADALAKAAGPAMRLERRSIGGVDVINDAYNANPDSMLAAIATLASAPSRGRRIAILGDMLELGDAGPETHAEIGRAIAEAPAIEGAVFVGPLMSRAAEVFRRARPAAQVLCLPDLEGEHARRAASFARPGDTVLLKGSRLMGLERIAAALEHSGPALRPVVHAPEAVLPGLG